MVFALVMVSLPIIIIIIIIITPPTPPKTHIATAEAFPELEKCSRRIYIIAADRNPPRSKKGRSRSASTPAGGTCSSILVSKYHPSNLHECGNMRNDASVPSHFQEYYLHRIRP